jgi:hypothetical protein
LEPGTWNLRLGICWKGLAFLLRPILYPASCILLLAGCAAKSVSLPSYEGVPVEEALAELRTISSIEAVVSVQYERGDTMMSGDAALTITESRLSLKVFYLGFLAAELTEENGVVKSTPRLDRIKSTILVEGLNNSVLWWTIRDYTIEEAGQQFIIMNDHRELILDRKTLLPLSQVLHLDSGERITISYAAPTRAESGNGDNDDLQHSPGHGDPRFQVLTSGFWYPSEMTIGFRNQVARVRVTSLTVHN